MGDQLKKNWDAYNAVKEEMEAKHLGKTVLLHDGKIIAIYNDSGDAYSIGCEKYGLGKFSIETIGKKASSLGVFTMHLSN